MKVQREIRYTSENALLEQKPLRVFRPRTIIYGTLLLGLFVAFFASIGSRTPLQLDVIRDRNSLYREVAGGQIENVYSLKVLNLDTQPHSYTVDLVDAPGMTLEIDGGEIHLEAGEVRRIAARIKAERGTLQGASQDVVLAIETRSEPPIRVETRARFIGPPPGR